MKLKLLMLEDSELDAELTIRELKDMEQSFDIRIVSTLEDFEQAFLRWDPDVVISDFNLRSFSGDEALIFAKRKNPDIPVVMLSGSITKNIEVTLLENRANDVLTKDNLKRLPFAINRVLNEKADKQKLNHTLYELAGNLKFQEALADISLDFNSTDSFEKKIDEALKILGSTADVSRVYIFEDFNKGKNAKNTFEWCAEGVASQIQYLQDLNYEEEMPSLKPMLLNEGIMISEDIQSLPKDIIAALAPQEIKSVIVYPISVGERFYGFIGFDEVREKRVWNSSEDKLLKSVSGIISNAISEYRSEQKLKKTNKKLNKLLSEKELLVGEVHHRVKNNLALISSFLQLDQMGLGVKDKEDIISANILRVKSIAIIHEIIYELGSFSNISVAKTLERVLEESFMQEKVYDKKVVVTSANKNIKFNINQAVPFSLLISEMFFEVFRLKGDLKYEPEPELKANITKHGNMIKISLFDTSLARIVAMLTELKIDDFSEIFKVLTKQIGANISLAKDQESLIIEFAYKDVKGASSSLS